MKRDQSRGDRPEALTPRAITPHHITEAAVRIAPHVTRTPLLRLAALSERVGATVVMKAEHLQHTGSFKIRGATNKLLSLSEHQVRAGVVAASTGNHGIAVAEAARRLGSPCTVVVTTAATTAKLAAIRRRGARVEIIDSADALDAETAARDMTRRNGLTYISPYNDAVVVAGQGTIASEILEQLPGTGLDALDAIVVAVGGGGLIAGIAIWLAEHAPGVRVIGASPASDAAMIASIRAGRITAVEASPTLSDGTSGGLEQDAVTFPLCARGVDAWMTVTETEIAHAVRDTIDDVHQLVEGAAGVAIAAAGRYAVDHPNARIAVVSCGGNIGSATLGALLAGIGSDH
jgi:threonine dehydratase